MNDLRQKAKFQTLVPGKVATLRSILIVTGFICGMMVSQTLVTASVGWQDPPSSSSSEEMESGAADFESLNRMYRDVQPRPAWVIKGDFEDTANRTKYFLVASEPRLKQREAEEELEERIVEIVSRHVEDTVAAGAGGAIDIDLDYIRENLLEYHQECEPDGIYHHVLMWQVTDSNRGLLDADEREAYQCYAQLKVDSQFEDWAEKRWESQVVKSRTMQIGLIGFGVLFSMILAFAYLAAEHKTRGFYSRRLQTVSFLCVVGAILIFWYLSSYFAWL